VETVRRCLALVTVAVAVTGIPPAGAHACNTPAEIPVGETSTIIVGVPAEQNPVVAVDVAIPSGFRLDKAPDIGPWRVERSGSLLRYRGGELAPYACASFNLEGAAERQAALAFAVTVRSPDGSEVRFDGEQPDDPHAAQLVYAGFSPPTTSDDGGSSLLSGSTVGLAATVAVIGGAYLLSRRLQRPKPAKSGTPAKPTRPARRRR
jgi:Uncharacterized protein conserved in bacteria